MSKAQRYKQQQKDLKKAKMPQPAKPAEDEGKKTLKQRQLENKEALRKHQASMTKLKAFEEKLHPKPAGEAAAPIDDGRTKSALSDIMFDGGNLSKDASRTMPIAHKESPSTVTRTVAPPAGGHEKNNTIIRF